MRSFPAPSRRGRSLVGWLARALVLAGAGHAAAARAADEAAPAIIFEEFEESVEAPVFGGFGEQLFVAPAPVDVAVLQDEPAPVAEEDAAGAEQARRDRDALGGILGAGVRAFFGVPANNGQPPGAVPPVEGEEPPQDPRRAVEWQRRRQIEQQARQMEQFFQPTLQTELEMIRRTCGGLAPEARRALHAAGREAVTRTAREFAARQLAGGVDRRTFDPRRGIRDPLAALLEKVADPAEFARYRREQELRDARRARAARVRIVAKLDRQLDLGAAQRAAIETDLERNWDPAWIRELDDHGGVIINNYRPAPDFADACIAPHLDAGQREEWERWRQAAGARVVGNNLGWNFDGQGLQQADDWWGN